MYTGGRMHNFLRLVLEQRRKNKTITKILRLRNHPNCKSKLRNNLNVSSSCTSVVTSPLKLHLHLWFGGMTGQCYGYGKNELKIGPAAPHLRLLSSRGSVTADYRQLAGLTLTSFLVMRSMTQKEVRVTAVFI